MNPIDTDTLRKFLADESRNMLEGMTKGNLYMSAAYVRLLKTRLTEQEHAVDALYLQRSSVSIDKSKKYHNFSTNNDFQFACFVIDGKNIVSVRNCFLSCFGLWELKNKFDKSVPELNEILVEYIRQNVMVSDEENRKYRQAPNFDNFAKTAAITKFILGADASESSLYLEVMYFFSVNDEELIDYLAAPTMWAKNRIESVIVNNPEEMKIIKKHLVFENAVDEKVRELETQPDSDENAYKSLIKATENFSTVRLLIEVNGEQIETKYPTECFYINDFAKRMVISVSHIPGRKEKNSVKDFVARNFTKNSDEIAIKYIKEARRGDKAIWTNPAPEKQ